MEHERSLVKRYAGKRFVVLGVNVGDDKRELRSFVKDNSISWRFWCDGKEMPIATKWRVRGSPTIYLLDTKGVIRFKNVFGEAMDKAVDELLQEMEGN